MTKTTENVQTSGQTTIEESQQTAATATVQEPAEGHIVKIIPPGDLMLRNLNQCTKEIKRAMVSVAKSFIYIGYRLWECKDDKSFEALGYKNIYEYAYMELGLKKSSTCNFINVCLRFAEKISENGVPTYTLSKSAENFSYSQLVEMLTLGDGDMEKVTPDMTVKDIRKLKAGEADSEESEETESVQTSGKTKVSLTSAKGKEYAVSLPLAMSKKLDTFVQSNRIPLEVIFKDALTAYLKSFKAKPKAATAPMAPEAPNTPTA